MGKLSRIIIALLVMTPLLGCAALGHFIYFEPSAENGKVQGLETPPILPYPRVPNMIKFPDTGIYVYCPNDSYKIIYLGYVISSEPLRVLPLFPGLLGYIISPLNFEPDDVTIELWSKDIIKSFKIDPKSIKLYTSDGSVHNPVKITYGFKNIDLVFDLRAWKTGSFVLAINNLLIDNSPIKSQIRFERKNDLRHFVLQD